MAGVAPCAGRAPAWPRANSQQPHPPPRALPPPPPPPASLPLTKSFRQHNKRVMVAFGILLMLAWLGAPAQRGVNQARLHKVVGKFDGKGITAEDQMTAAKEIGALDSALPMVARSFLGIEDRDTTHWLLLAREAA